MALDFSNASLLGYNVTNEFLGDTLNHRKIMSINIQGFVNDGALAGNTEGVSETYTKIIQQIAATNDYWDNNIVINGKNFGYGRVTSLSFDSSPGTEGDQIRYGQYAASLEIPQEGDYDKNAGVTAGTPTPTALAAIGGRYINGWEENLDIKKESDGSATASLSLSIDIMSGVASDMVTDASSANISTPLATIKKAVAYSIGASNKGSVLYDLLKSNGLDLAFYSSTDKTIENAEVAGNWSEDYDLINFTANINKDFKVYPDGNTPYAAGSTAGFAYTAKTSRTLSKGNDGAINVAENGEVMGLSESNRWHNMTGGLEETIDGAHARCLITYNDFVMLGMPKQDFTSSVESLTSYPQSIGRQFESGAGRGSYNISFTNKSGIGSEFNHEYTQDLSRDARGIITVSENGTITSVQQKDASWTGPNVSTYTTMSEGHALEFATYYNAWDPMHAVPVINLTSESIQWPRYGKQVGYKRSYTSDPSVLPDGHASNLKQFSLNVSDTAPIPINQPFLVPHRGDKGEVVHQPGQTQAGTRTINIGGQFSRDCGVSALTGDVNNVLSSYWLALEYIRDNVFLPEAYLAPSQVPGIIDMYVKDMNYSINSEGKINFTANLEYTAARVNPEGAWTDNNSNYNT